MIVLIGVVLVLVGAAAMWYFIKRGWIKNPAKK